MAQALRAALALVALAGTLPARGDSIQCDGGIVSVGDTKLDLLGKCGAAALEGQPVEVVRLAPRSPRDGGARARRARRHGRLRLLEPGGALTPPASHHFTTATDATGPWPRCACPSASRSTKVSIW